VGGRRAIDAGPLLDRASVTVRTWGLEGGRGLFEMEFSFGSAFPPWVNRVDFARSALASGIHNTGQYHVRSRPVCLPPSPELLTTGATAAAPAFYPRPAKRDDLHLRSTKTQGINCAESAWNLLAFCLSWFLSGGGLAKDSAGPARRRLPTA
jgi:hypothetical protein